MKGIPEKRRPLVRSLPLLLAAVVTVIGRDVAAVGGDLGCDLEENLAKLGVLIWARRSRHWRCVHVWGLTVGSVHVGVVNQVHNDSAGTVSARVLGEVVRARELLATLIALKGLILSVKGAVVTLQVLLSSEAPVTQLADEGLGRVLGQGLLATTAVLGRHVRGAATLGAARGVSTSVRGAGLWGGAAALVLVLRGLLLLLLRLALLAICGVLHLDALVAVFAVCRVWRAGHAEGLILVVVVVVKAAGSSARARTRPCLIGSRCVLLAEVDKAVDKAVLRLEIREVVENWQAVRDWWGNLCERAGMARRVGVVRGVLRLVHKVTLFVVARAKVGQGGEFGSESGIDSADSQVARITEIVVL